MRFKLIITIFLFFITPSFAVPRNNECKELFRTYNINPDIKSYKGWQRVCVNDKLELYTNKKISEYYKINLCECFYNDYKNRDVESSR